MGARLAAFLGVALALAVASFAYASTESTYTVWTPGYPNDASLPTPHKDFQLTTSKCAVCHSIHKAPRAGEALLRSSIADACTYCHIDTDVGQIRIYNGVMTAYTADIKQNHSRDGGAPCTGCHSVHGANCYEGPIATKILKRLPIQPSLVRLFTDATNTPEPFYTGAFPYMSGAVYCSPPYQYENWGGPKVVQQTAFCTGCHPYYTRASEDTITTDHMTVDGVMSTATISFKSHPMKRYYSYDASGNMIIAFEAQGATIPSSTQVAFMSANGCFRCHGENYYVDLGPGLHASSFPHYTPARERFLISATRSGMPTDTADSSQDGTCFYCHLGYADTRGVGITY